VNVVRLHLLGNHSAEIHQDKAPITLALVLHRTSDMSCLASCISRCRKEDECHGDFNGHARPSKRRRRGCCSKTLDSLGSRALSGWLQRRPDNSGRNGVHANALGRLLLRECAGERRDGALSGAVVDHGWVACVAGDRAAVDDDGASRHVRQSVLADGHHGDDVQLERLFDDVQVDILVVHADFLVSSLRRALAKVIRIKPRVDSHTIRNKNVQSAVHTHVLVHCFLSVVEVP
jgi:hypothetical protein